MASNESLDLAAKAFVNTLATCAQMTPREQAEAAWSPTSPYSVEELEDRIRVRRGMPRIHDAKSA